LPGTPPTKNIYYIEKNTNLSDSRVVLIQRLASAQRRRQANARRAQSILKEKRNITFVATSRPNSLDFAERRKKPGVRLAIAGVTLKIG
jgi:hypothetical protein